jgi:hypothetical protein
MDVMALYIFFSVLNSLKNYVLLMELMIRIYGLFKKMGPKILFTLTAPKNLTSAYVKECCELH